MERWPGWWRAPRGPPRPPAPLPAPWLLGLLLLPWTLQLGGGQSVIHIGPPIMVSLAKKAVSFRCSITYPYTTEFMKFSVSYSHVNLQGQLSPETPIVFEPSPGTVNQTHTVQCQVTPQLPNASATGTYYCSVHWPSIKKTGNGTFILVRDAGYQEPPLGPKRQLLFGFTGLLVALSGLGTALLIWKKKGRQLLGKHPAQKCPDPRVPSRPEHPAAESVYTALQRRETEVYAYIDNEAGIPPSAQSHLTQEDAQEYKDEGELNLVYENL